MAVDPPNTLIATSFFSTERITMNFGQAIWAMKLGARVQRAGWNGKGMWVALTPGTVIAKKETREGAARLYAQNPGNSAPLDSITIAAHIDMRAADGTLVIGWLASQTDMLAEDWSEVSAEELRRAP